jgi:hypothetical protein
LELKKGGFEIHVDERRQAEDYVRELRKSGKVQDFTKIIAFVLGSKIAGDCESVLVGGQNTSIIPCTYSVVLRSAHARTFNLLEKIRKIKDIELSDREVEQALATEKPDQGKLKI